MTKKTNPRKDFTQLAFEVFQQAIGESEPEKKFATKKEGSEKEEAQANKPAPDESKDNHV